MRISFEARTDRPAASFAAVYLFEGAQYRHVAQYAFSTPWRRFSVLLKPNSATDLKVQIDYPEGVEWMEVRDFRVTPLDPVGGAG